MYMSMAWNYRTMKYECGSFGLHEVFYKENGEIDGFTDTPVVIYDNNTDFLEVLKMMKEAQNRTIIDFDTHEDTGEYLKSHPTQREIKE